MISIEILYEEKSSLTTTEGERVYDKSIKLFIDQIFHVIAWEKNFSTRNSSFQTIERTREPIRDKNHVIDYHFWI